MNIWQEAVADGVWVVGVNGRLDQTLNPTLEQNIATLLEKGQAHLIVDLTQANYINSGGLAHARSPAGAKPGSRSGNLVLCGLNGRLQEIFGMVGFDQLFQIYATRQAALTSLTES